VRLAQGLETTPFPLPAVPSQAFVALPVHREVDGGILGVAESAGISCRKIFNSAFYSMTYTTSPAVIPAEAGTQYPPALRRLP